MKSISDKFWWRGLIAGLGAALAGGGNTAEHSPHSSPAPTERDAFVWQADEALGLEGRGWTDTASLFDRLPARAKERVRPPVWGLSHCSAGMAVRFTTDASVLRVRWTLTRRSLALPHMAATGVSGVDLYVRDATGRLRFCRNGRPTAVTNEVTFPLPGGREYVLYLPLYNGVKHLALGVPAGKKLVSLPPRPLSEAIVFYGTSITQGGCASRPGTAFPAWVGRALDRPVINLGFSGNGKMEPELADLLAELNPAVYVLDCLPNMTVEMVSERVEPFVRRLRAAHPDTPILLAEDPNVRDTPTPKGKVLRRIYARLKAGGDAHLYFLPNTHMLGEDQEGTVDGTHPTDLGMAREAAVFTRCLRPILARP
jgi:lysophospholipase L1-like esterase